ncbi:MAG: EI24 domain-containing protein [Limibacillus sp.]|jgi:CysZ protein
MFSALGKAFSQLSDPRVRRVLFWSLGLALVIFFALWAGLGFLVTLGGDSLAAFVEGAGWGSPWSDIADWIATLGGFLLLIVVSFLVFPGVVSMIVPLFMDQVAGAVEERHYPALPPAREQPVSEMLGDAVKLGLVTVGLNLAALPFYLIFLFIPGLNLVLFYLLNGYLFGREYFELVAVRRLGRDEMKKLWLSRKRQFMLAGVVITFLFSVPIVNLIAPVVGTAFMVHLFQRETVARSRG